MTLRLPMLARLRARGEMAGVERSTLPQRETIGAVRDVHQAIAVGTRRHINRRALARLLVLQPIDRRAAGLAGTRLRHDVSSLAIRCGGISIARTSSALSLWSIAPRSS